MGSGTAALRVVGVAFEQLAVGVLYDADERVGVVFEGHEGVVGARDFDQASLGVVVVGEGPEARGHARDQQAGRVRIVEGDGAVRGRSCSSGCRPRRMCRFRSEWTEMSSV